MQLAFSSATVEEKPMLPSEYELAGIEVLTQSIETTEAFRVAPAPVKRNQMDVGVSLVPVIYDSEESLPLGAVQLRLEISGLNEDNQPLGIKASFEYRFTFQFKNLANYLERNKTETINLRTLIPLAGTAFSTARGMVFSSLATSPFGNVILPVINPLGFFEADKARPK